MTPGTAAKRARRGGAKAATAALIGAAALGGCVLIYHPGDYATGGGGSTSGSTASSDTGTGGARTDGGGGAQPDGGPPSHVCTLDGGSGCTLKATWDRWLAPEGTPVPERAVLGVANAPEGGILVTGYFAGTLDLHDADGTTVASLPGVGNANAGFVARMSSAGGFDAAQAWAVRTGFAPSQLGSVTAIGDAGVAIAAFGTMSTTVGATGGPLVWRTDTDSPEHLLSASSRDTGAAIVPADDGGALALGVLGASKNASFTCEGDGTSHPIDERKGPTLVLTKLAPGSTSCSLVKSYPAFDATTGDALVVRAAVHAPGLVFVAGEYQGHGPALDAAMQLPWAAEQSAFVMALRESDGEMLWYQVYGGAALGAAATAQALSVRGHRLYVAGGFTNSLDGFGSGVPALVAGGSGEDAFVARLDLDKGGAADWAVRIGGTGDASEGAPMRRAFAVAASVVNPAGAVFVAGTSNSPMTATLGGSDGALCQGVLQGGIFLLRIDDDGAKPTARWGACFGEGGGTGDEVRLAATDGRVILAGKRSGAIDFGSIRHDGNEVTPVGFIAAFDTL